MSSYSNKHQSKAVYIRSSVPIKFQTARTAHVKPGRFSNYDKLSKFGSNSNREESFAYYLYTYVFQDHPDDSNTVFYDSNLQKYRTRSSVRTHSNKDVNKTYNNISSYKASKKDLYYSASSSVMAKESAFSSNRPINTLNFKRKENAENRYANKGLYTNNMNVKKDNQEREEIFRQLEKEKDELLGSSNYSNYRRIEQEQNINVNEENIDYNQFQNNKLNINQNINSTNKSLKESVKNENQKVIGLRDDNFEQNQNQNLNIQNIGKSPFKKEEQQLESSSKKNLTSSSQQNKQKSSKKKESQKLDSSKQPDQTSPFQQNSQNIQKSPTKKESQKLDNSKLNVISPLLQDNLNTQKSPTKKINISSNKKSNKKVKSPNKLIQSKKSPSKDANKRIEDFQNNSIPPCQNNEDININKNNVENEKQNLGISQENKLSKFSNQPIPQSLQNNPYQGEMTHQNKENMNYNEELNRLSNISVVKKHEEKTILLVPGQTLEPTNKSETLENPIEEIIQNPDGTTTSVIKQTKIITTTENVPIEDHKIKSIEGAPELPMIKQYITYEYKTVTAIKEDNKEGQQLDEQNKLRNFNIGNKGSPRQYIQQGLDQYGNQVYDQYGDEQYGNEGYGQQGYEQYGNQGYGQQGYGKQGYGQKGYDQYGNEGYGQQGYDQYGNEGYGQQGYDQYGNEGYDQQGYCQYGNGGYEQQGISQNAKYPNAPQGYGQQGLSQSGKKINVPQGYDQQGLGQSGKKINVPQGYDQQGLSQSGKKANAPQGYNQYGNKGSGNKGNIKQGYDQYEKEGNNQTEFNQIGKKGIKENKNEGNRLTGMPGDNKKNIKNNLNDNLKDKNSQKERNIKGKVGPYGNQYDREQHNNKKLKENKQRNFSPDVLPKEFKTEEEIENFLDEINQKGEKATPEEKQKRLKCFVDIFNNISKGGINSEENLQKLSALLGNLNEKDKNEILSKLEKDFPKNVDLFKKLDNLVKKVKSDKNQFKGKGEQGELKLFGSEKKEIKSKKNEFLMKSGYGESGYGKGISKEGMGSNSKDLVSSEIIEVKNVNPLKFDGLFLEISEYNNELKEKNPFEGPSPYTKFYKERKVKIKRKIINMGTGEDGNEEIKIEDEKETK